MRLMPQPIPASFREPRRWPQCWIVWHPVRIRHLSPCSSSECLHVWQLRSRSAPATFLLSAARRRYPCGPLGASSFSRAGILSSPARESSRAELGRPVSTARLLMRNTGSSSPARTTFSTLRCGWQTQIHEQVKFAADGTRRRSVRVGHIRINRDADLLGHLSTCDAELIHPRASSWGSMTIIQ